MMVVDPDLNLKKAALISGFGYILMFGTPVAEFGIMEKLVNMKDAHWTVESISNNLMLFRTGILCYVINFIGDIVAAWGIYVLLKPVSNVLSMTAASLRIIFTILSLATLMNLLTVVQLLQPYEYLRVFGEEQIQAQVMIAIRAFRQGWLFCYVFFGLYLMLTGYLAFISGYIPRLIGICLIVAGLGWMIDSVQFLLFPASMINIGMMTGALELAFMLWLFIGGSRLKTTPQP